MPNVRLYTPLKVLSWIVLLLMFAALAYAIVMSIRYSGPIGV